MSRMRKTILLFCALLFMLGCGSTDEHRQLNESELFGLQQYILTHQQSPAEYVLSRFVDHDVVLLGEFHRIKDNPLLVQELIPLLYKEGIYTLAYEFANRDDQQLIDSLLNGSTYDTRLAHHIQLNQYSLWPWQEYHDVYKVAWELNRNLPDTACRFQILGLNCNVDWSIVKTRADLDNPEVRKKVWHGCTEEHWAEVVLERVRQGEKVLAYSGMHHAFTRYRQPRMDAEANFTGWGDVRFGNHIFEEIGDRCMTVFLHSAWYHINSGYNTADRRPADGVVDLVMSSLGDRFAPVGFDVVGSPFESLTDPTTLYSVGYENFSLGDYCDGYIYFRPFDQFETVTFVEGYYNAENIDLARRKVGNPRYRDADPEFFESRMKSQIDREEELYHSL